MDLYWVEGTGNTNDINHYSSSSGGLGGYALPTLNDNVFFDSNSSLTPNYTVTFNATFNCANFSMVGIDTTNLVGNYDFSSHPASSVPHTSGTSNYIDGTSSGSSSDPGYGGWRCGNSGSWAVEFDQTDETYPHAIRLETTGTGSYLQIRSNGSSGYYGTNGFSLLPSTKYKLTYKMRTEHVSGDSASGAYAIVMESNADGSGYGSSSAGTLVKTTTDWTYYEVVFTTGPNVAWGHVELRIYGHSGAGTLIMKAWFAEITVMPCITMAGTSAINVYGDLTFGGISQIERTYSGTLTMRATSGTKAITTNELNFRNLYMNGTGGTFQLSGDLYLNGNADTCAISRTAGTFLHNNKTVYIKNCYSARITNMTGTSTNRFYNLRIDGLATQRTRVFMGDRQGMNIANKLTAKGQAGDYNRLFIHTSKTCSFSGPYSLVAAEIEAEYLDLNGFTVSGGANWDLSGIPGGSGDAGGNDGVTFTTGVTRTWNNASGGNWGDSANWDTGVPLPQDNCDMGIAYTSGANIILNSTVAGKNIDFTGATGNPTFTMSACNNGSNNIICGSLTLIEGMTFNHSNRRLIFLGNDPIYITSAGKHFYNVGGNQNTIHLNDDIVADNYIQMGCGFDSHGYDINAKSFRSDNGQFSSAMETTTWNFRTSRIYLIGENLTYVYGNQHSGTVYANDAYLEVTGTGANYFLFLFNDSNDNNRAFRGYIFVNTTTPIFFSWATTASYKWNSFINKVKIIAGGTLGLCEGKTATINEIVSLGTATNPVKIRSSTEGTTASMTCGKTINTQYLDIKDISCTTPSMMYVGPESIDSGNTSGFTYKNAPILKINSLTKDLVLHYKLDEKSGTTVKNYGSSGVDGSFKIYAISYYPFNGNANDYSINTSNGTVNGATLSEGRLGDTNGAYSFDGVDDGIDMVNTSEIVSVSFWMKKTDAWKVNEMLFLEKRSGNTVGFSIFRQGTNDLNAYFVSGSTTYRFKNYTTDWFYLDDVWHHYVLVFNSTTKYLTIYRDNVYYTSLASDYNAATGSISSLHMGYVTNTFTLVPFKGELDEILICGGRLSVNDIDRLYTIGKDLNNPYIDGKIGKGAFELWGTQIDVQSPGSFIQGGTNSIPIINQEPWTISFWAYGDSNANRSHYAEVGWYGGNYKGPLIYPYSDASLKITAGKGYTTGVWSNFGATIADVCPLGQWNHIVYLYNGDYLKVYVNDVNVYEYQIGTYVDNGNGTQLFKVGKQPWDYNRSSNGYFDDVRVYKRAITEDEIKLLYETNEPNLVLSSLTKGLVGSWALDGSTLTKDKTVNENNGTIGGNPSLTSDEKGHANKAMYFDGNGDYIGYRDSTSFPPLLPAGLSASSFSVRFRYDGQGNGSDKRGFIFESYSYRNSLFVETNGVLSVIIATTGNGEKFVTTFSPTIGQWYNVTCILTGGYLKVYVDGQFHSEQARSGTTYEVTKLRIGTFRDANNRWWKGAIRNVKFWNRALSEAEIIKLYNTYE